MGRGEVTAHHRIYAKVADCGYKRIRLYPQSKIAKSEMHFREGPKPQNNEFITFLNYARKIEHPPCHKSWLEACFQRDSSANFFFVEDGSPVLKFAHPNDKKSLKMSEISENVITFARP